MNTTCQNNNNFLFYYYMRIYFFAWIIMAIILLNSCIVKNGKFYLTEDEAAAARLKQITDSIENKNKNALKKLFSKQALLEAVDFDEGMEYIFDSLLGSIESWEKYSGISTSENRDNYKRKRMVLSDFKVTTTEDEYYFFIVEYTHDDFNPDNTGVYMLFVTRFEEKDMHYIYWQDILCAGIYKP